jgi:hypothetical protein
MSILFEGYHKSDNRIGIADDSAVIERVIVGIRREGTEIACLDLDSCLSQQVEEAPYGVHRHLEPTQDDAIFLQDG